MYPTKHKLETNEMIVVTYIFPQNGANGFFDLALRFIQSYTRFPANADHQMVVVCNGSPVTPEAEALFGEIPNCVFVEHDNSGYDIGGFEKVSREVPADLMVFFGATAYVRGPGWLSRMVEAWKKHGDTLYGCMGNRGVPHVGVQPHIRTTGFFLSSSLFNAYPHKVSRPEQRYAFEHGKTCLTSWIKSRRLTPWLVYWNGEYQEPAWDSVPGGYHNADQHNLICGDRLTMPPYHSVP